MRKIPWAEEFLENDSAVVDARSLRGNWKKTLNKEKLELEIGMGKGDYCLGMSQLFPEIAWIGMEKNPSVAALAVKKFREKPTDNILFIQDDAAFLNEFFEDGELDVIHLNFSDPWPKNRTAKRRLSSPKFIEHYKNVLDDEGEIQMKTDNQLLFEYSLVTFADYGFKLVDVSVDFRREEHDEDVISEYERKFMDKGQPIYRAVWIKGEHKNEI